MWFSGDDALMCVFVSFNCTARALLINLPHNPTMREKCSGFEWYTEILYCTHRQHIMLCEPIHIDKPTYALVYTLKARVDCFRNRETEMYFTIAFAMDGKHIISVYMFFVRMEAMGEHYIWRVENQRAVLCGLQNTNSSWSVDWSMRRQYVCHCCSANQQRREETRGGELTSQQCVRTDDTIHYLAIRCIICHNERWFDVKLKKFKGEAFWWGGLKMVVDFVFV